MLILLQWLYYFGYKRQLHRVPVQQSYPGTIGLPLGCVKVVPIVVQALLILQWKEVDIHSKMHNASNLPRKESM